MNPQAADSIEAERYTLRFDDVTAIFFFVSSCFRGGVRT